MPYSIHYDKEISCIMVVVDGELDIALLQRMASETATITNRQDCRLILNDLRKAKPSKVFEVYKMPEIAAQSGINQSYRRALVVGDKAPDFHFLETVFINRGNKVKMFENFEEARDWLIGN